MVGRRDGTNAAGGPLIGSVGAGELRVGDSTGVTGEHGVVVDIGARAGMGSFRTEEGTSGRGANSATSASISRRLPPEAFDRTA